MERVVVYVPQMLHKDLKEKLAKEGKTLSWWVRGKMEEELPPTGTPVDEVERPIVIKEKKDVKKVLDTVEPDENKALGWCSFVSKEGHRCSRMAAIFRRSGNVCEEHGR